MAIRAIPNVTCSLGLGSIYNFSYNYTPQEGVKITIYFVNESGVYPISSSILSSKSKTFIRIGGATFSLYPIKYEIMQSVERKIAKVDFVDDTFKLNNYLVVLTGKGCGQNIYQLGSPVDNRTLQEKISASLDSASEKIKDFTQFPDLEYSFSDFLAVLRQQFPTQVSAFIDPTVTRSFTGTFQEVLNEWCAYLNLTYFFENSVLKIINPAKLSISFPSKPTLALSYNISESIENTFSTTAFSYFQQEGKSINLSDSPDSDGSNSNTNSYIKYVTLYPVGYDILGQQQDNNISTYINAQKVDLNQVAAAMYGKEYWFLYNYWKGTLLSECGWTSTYFDQLPPNTNIYKALNQLKISGPNTYIALLDQEIFDQKFEFYKIYGEKIAGRYYISIERTDPDDDQYQWYDNTNQNTDFNIGQKIAIDYIKGDVFSRPKVIPGTEINAYYQGISLTGNRLAYYDNKIIDFKSIFSLDIDLKNIIESLANNILNGMLGSEYIDYSEIGKNKQFLIYQDQTITQDIVNSFNKLNDLASTFNPSYQRFNIIGYAKSQLKNLTTKKSNDSNKDILLNQNSGKIIISDTGIIQVKDNSDYLLYYQKYQKCDSRSTIGGFTQKFVQKSIPFDAPVTFKMIKGAKNTYQLDRDLTLINNYFRSQILDYLAVKFSIPLKTVSFSLNYFDTSIPVSFISNGLTSMNVEISDNGISANYTYSNSMLVPPISQSFLDQLEREIKNSWIRKFDPSITTV